MTLWRIEATLLFPKDIPLSEGDLPKQLEPVSRIRTVSRTIDDISMVFKRSPRETGNLFFDFASLVFLANADDPRAALANVAPHIETAFESVAYQLQQVPKIHDLEVIDVTPPVVVGDQRSMLYWPAPLGYQTAAFQPAMVSFGLTTLAYPDPTRYLDQSEPRLAKALDWYLKALRTDLQADQFMFLWIATEILSDGSKMVEAAPIKLRCGHVVAHCSECGMATEKPIKGKSHQRYLRDVFGLTADDAEKVWEMRQMLHGAIRLDSKKMSLLPALSKMLRIGLIHELNRYLGLAADGPRLDPNSVSMAPGTQVEGTRLIVGWHLDGLT